MNVERPALRYFGGKWVLAPWIIGHFPKHRVYVEPFGGGASVLLRKERSFAEVYNELDGEIVNVFHVIREHGEELRVLLEATPFARAEFDLAHEPAESRIERARRSIIRSFMGHGADSLTGTRSGFRAVSNTQNRSAALDWINYAPALPAIQQRLSGVVIENRDAKDVMLAQDGPDTLHFVDPPYVHATRGRSKKRANKHGYRCEMTDADHEVLCDFLVTLKGMVVLCGYPNEVYSRLGWESVERASLSDGAGKRTEVLWMNPACIAAQSQQKLDL